MWLTKEFRGTVSQGRLVSCSPNHSRPTFFFVVVVVVRPREIPFIHGQIVSRQLNSASVAQTYRVKSVVWGVLKNQVVPTCSAHCIESSGLFHRREKKKRGGGAVFKSVNRKLKVWEPLWKKNCDLQKSKSWELNPPQSMNSASL